MTTQEKRKELIDGLYDAVVKMDEERARKLSLMALEEAIDAYEAVNNGLTEGMHKVGDLYANKEYFVPELLLCSDAFYAALEILQPHIKAGNDEEKRKMVLGTIAGDIHDIGKNIVKIMFESSGWTVHDLGTDVAADRFVEEQKRTKSEVVALSALMTTSMIGLPGIIEKIKAEDPGVAVIVGGAPLTRDIAASFGADGYADNAGEAVNETNEMLERLGN